MKSDMSLDDIISENLRLFPKNLHEIYIDLIKNILILPEVGNEREYVKLCSLISDSLGFDVSIKSTCIIEHDSTGVRSQFFRANNLDGRMDVVIPFNTVTNLLQLTALSLCAVDKRLEPRKILNSLFNDIPFIILADQVLSGISLAGDGAALRRLLDIFEAPKKNVIAAVCRGTNVAIKSLCKIFNSVVVVEQIPDSASIFSDDSKFCLSGKRGDEVKSLTKWFRRNLVPKGGLLERMERTLNDPELGFWGVGRGGWLMTTSSNTPNNSLPLLWYTPENSKYVAPYPRVSSRLYENDVWNLRPIFWNIIEKNLRDC